jgi:hypothetical protein
MSGRERDGRVKLPIIIPIPGATTVNRVNENLRQVELDEEDMRELDEALSRISVQGGQVWWEAGGDGGWVSIFLIINSRAIHV